MFPVFKIILSLLKCNCSHDLPKIKCNCSRSYLEIIYRKQIAKIHRPHSPISIFSVTDSFKTYLQFFLVKTSPTSFLTPMKMQGRKGGKEKQ